MGGKGGGGREGGRDREKRRERETERETEREREREREQIRRGRRTEETTLYVQTHNNDGSTPTGRGDKDDESIQAQDSLRRSLRSASRLDRMKRNRNRVQKVHEPLREIETKVRDARVRSIIGHRVRYYEALQTRFDRDVARQSAAGV